MTNIKTEMGTIISREVIINIMEAAAAIEVDIIKKADSIEVEEATEAVEEEVVTIIITETIEMKRRKLLQIKIKL